MSQFYELIVTAENAGLKERNQFTQYFLNVIRKSVRKLTAEDINALREYAFRQVDVCAVAISNAGTYKEKDVIFELEDMTLGMIMMLCPNPGDVPADKLMKIQALVKMVEEERKIETTLEGIMKQDSVQESDITRLLYWVKQSCDEYQRSILYSGLLHFRDRLRLFSDGAKQKLSEHLSGEMRRILNMEAVTGEPLDALELLSDVCKLCPNSDTPSLLNEILNLRENQVSYFAVESLLTLGQDVPQWAIEDLAKDLVQANLLYGILERYGKAHLFPSELATEEYLAKSDMIHWLTYPTELGQAPDEIQYIGKIKYLFKKEVYHVFKFRSISDTLGEDQKNKWLIGWSSRDGGTFSNFDEFEKFDLGDTAKTLKNIKKKLIG